MNPKTIVGLGELLWDLLPGGPQLGGAPANYAVMAARLGNRAVIASRVGEDDLGAQALEHLARFPAETNSIERDPLHATGAVGVTIAEGQPEYTIQEPAAWDFLELTPAWQELAAAADAVCFGTLAQRSATSRRTIQAFLAATTPACVRVFDVNLRAPFYTAKIIEDSLHAASIFKLNDAEMPEVLALLGLAPDGRDPFGRPEMDDDALLAGARRLLAGFPIALVCVTMGGSGSLLVTSDAYDRHPGVPVKVVDTVGAGDAFTAALTDAYLKGAPLATINEAGNRWGSWVASQHGGIPQELATPVV